MDLKGKKALVMGVANNYSIAYGISRALVDSVSCAIKESAAAG